MQLLRYMSSKAHGIRCHDWYPWSYLESWGVCGYWDCPSWNRIVDLNHSHPAKQWSPPDICRISTDWSRLSKHLRKLKRILLVPWYSRHKRLTCLSPLLYFPLSSVGTFLFWYFPMFSSLQIKFERGLVYVYHSWGGLVVDPNGIWLFPIIFVIAELNQTVGLISCRRTNFCQRPRRCSVLVFQIKIMVVQQDFGCWHTPKLCQCTLWDAPEKYGKLYYNIDNTHFSLFVMVAGVSLGDNMTDILK